MKASVIQQEFESWWSHQITSGWQEGCYRVTLEYLMYMSLHNSTSYSIYLCACLVSCLVCIMVLILGEDAPIKITDLWKSGAQFRIPKHFLTNTLHPYAEELWRLPRQQIDLPNQSLQVWVYCFVILMSIFS